MVPRHRRHRRRLARRRLEGAEASSSSWLKPVAIGTAVVGVGGLLYLAFGRDAAAASTAGVRGPWNLRSPIDIPQVTNGWGEPRGYRCICDTAPPFNTKKPCTTKGVDGFCSSIPIHEGLDFVAPIGTKVYAVADGVVRVADDNPQTYISGQHIGIEHAGGLASSYVHLSRVLVKAGQTVKRGQLIGRSGNSGSRRDDKRFPPHLHFTLRAMTPAALATYSQLFGEPKSGFGGRTVMGTAFPAEPLTPAYYSARIIKTALARGVAPPRQMTRKVV